MIKYVDFDNIELQGDYVFNNVVYPKESLIYYSPLQLGMINLRKIEIPDPEVKITSVTAAQALCALDNAGLYEQVDTTCMNHPVRAVRIWYTRGGDWERDNAYIAAVQLELGLSDDQVDALFKAASLK